MVKIFIISFYLAVVGQLFYSEGPLNINFPHKNPDKILKLIKNNTGELSLSTVTR